MLLWGRPDEDRPPSPFTRNVRQARWLCTGLRERCVRVSVRVWWRRRVGAIVSPLYLPRPLLGTASLRTLACELPHSLFGRSENFVLMDSDHRRVFILKNE